MYPRPADGDHVARVGRIGLDLGAQPPDVYVHQTPVAEVPEIPHPLEEHLSAEYLAGIGGQLHQKSELSLGEVGLFAADGHHPLLGHDLQLAEPEIAHGGVGDSHSAQQGADAGGELFGGEGLGQIVVGPGLQSGHHVMGVGSGGDHDDGHVAGPAQGAAHLEPVGVGKHDVDEHHIGGRLGERGERLLSVGRLLNVPALVFEGQAHRGTNPLVVFNGQDAGFHP